MITVYNKKKNIHDRFDIDVIDNKDKYNDTTLSADIAFDMTPYQQNHELTIAMTCGCVNEILNTIAIRLEEDTTEETKTVFIELADGNMISTVIDYFKEIIKTLEEYKDIYNQIIETEN